MHHKALTKPVILNEYSINQKHTKPMSGWLIQERYKLLQIQCLNHSGTLACPWLTLWSGQVHLENCLHSEPFQQTRLGHLCARLWGECLSNICTDVPHTMTKYVQQSVNSVFQLFVVTDKKYNDMTWTRLITLSSFYVTWEKCTIRAGAFIGEIFGDREISAYLHYHI